MAFLNEQGLELLWLSICTKIEEKMSQTGSDGVEALWAKFEGLDEDATLAVNITNMVNEAISELINEAPENLNTLKEIANAINNDPNFSTTIANQLGNKADSSFVNDIASALQTAISELGDTKLDKEDYLGPVVLEGNPIIYESGTEGLGIAAVSYLEPKQGGSGDPYPAGGGRNKLPTTVTTQTVNGVTFTVNADGSVTANGTASQTIVFYTATDVPFAAGSYILNGCPSGGGGETYSIRLYAPDGSILDDSGAGYEFTTGAQSMNAAIVIRAGVTVSNLAFKLMVRFASDPDATYAPPSNIRPISGYDTLKLTAAGKNLFNPHQNYEIFTNSTVEGDVISTNFTSNGALHVKEGNVHPAGTYTLSIVPISGFEGFTAWLYYADNNEEKQISPINASTLTATIVADRPFKIGFGGIYRNPDHVCSYKVQLEVSSVPSAYESHQGKVYTIQIGQTVYGGKFDWLTGKLTTEWAYRALTGDENIQRVSQHEFYRFDIFGVMPGIVSAVGENLNLVCSHYRVAGHPIGDNTVNCCISGYSNSEHVYIRDDAHTSVEAYKAYLAAQYAAGTPVQIVYKLVAPIEIQLTPTQISELEGINTLYGNGSNIRAIFNTTGSASPILESISGILPVEKGGTGSTNAAEARNNLGITPQNIGALPTTGGDVTGRLVVNGGENYVDFSVIRKINGSEHTACLLPNSNTGCTELFYIKDGMTICNYLSLKETYTAFMKPVDVASGGTGAADATTARANLGITPSNIGAVPITGGVMSGSLSAQRSDDQWISLHTARKFNGVLHEANLYTDPGVAAFAFLKNGEWSNGLTLHENHTTLTKPLLVNSGGTGANNRHGALTNLCAFGGYTRGDMGDSPNFDNPGMNGLFEVRSTSETPNATGVRPFDGFGPLLSFKTPDNIAMLQIVGHSGHSLMWRSKQASEVTLANEVWRNCLDDFNYTNYTVTKTGVGASGTWGIDVTGSAASLSGAGLLTWGGDHVLSSSNRPRIKLHFGQDQLYIFDSNNSTYHSILTSENYPSYACKLSGDNLISTPTNGNLAASDVSGAWFKDYQLGSCMIGRGNGDGATLGTSGVANMFIKSWYGVGFVDMQGGKGVTVAIDCRTGNVAASSFSGSGANLTSLNAENISSGTLALERGGTGSTSAAGARTNLGICGAITHGTGDPSGGSDGDIYFKHA